MKSKEKVRTDPSLSSGDTLASLTQQNVDTITKIEEAARRTRTSGDKVSDTLAHFIGSWAFILTQGSLLVTWVLLDAVAWMRHWDPYPYILLNLALSLQAAFTGPVIMISQNRQAKELERREQLDLQINLLAEQENTEMLRLLRLLCQKSGIKPQDLATMGMLCEETKAEDLIQQIEKKPRGTSPGED